MITPQEFVLRWQETQIDTQIALLSAEDDDFDDYDLWGCSPFVRYEATLVNSLPLSEEARHFLCEAGLPSRIFRWRLDYLSQPLPPLTEAVDEYTYPKDYARYRVLGVELIDASWGEEVCWSFICVDLESGGRIVRIGLGREDKAKFLNSSIAQFAECVLLFRNFREWCLTHHPYPLSEPDDDDRNEHAERLIQQLQHVDSKAGQQHNWQDWLW